MRSKLIPAAFVLPLILLAACNRNDPDSEAPQVTQAAESAGADSMASNDQVTADAGEGASLDAGERTIMQAQVVLDRLGFSSGVIDGQQSMRLSNALHGFQEAQGLPVTGELDDATRQALVRWNTIPATRLVTIPAAWGQMTFTPVPEGAPQQRFQWIPASPGTTRTQHQSCSALVRVPDAEHATLARSAAG